VSITLNVAAFKSIIADLNHGDKLSEKNYDVWHHKIEYLLEEQEMLEQSHNRWLNLSKKILLSIGLIWKHIKLISARIV
jgi:hypothetical protein